MKLRRIALLLVLVAIGFTIGRTWLRNDETKAATIATLANATSQGTTQAAPPQRSVPATRLAVAFRLDPELTQGLFLGERWVSPPNYLFAQQGRQYVVQAKLQQIDGSGERTDVGGDWAASDPQMVGITRGNSEVTLVVRRPGASTLTASTRNGSKVLRVRATQSSDAMQVEITQ